MQIIVNDYVLQRLQQLPLSSTRLARSTLRILVFQKSSRNLLWLALSEKNSFDVFVVALQRHFVYD